MLAFDPSDLLDEEACESRRAKVPTGTRLEAICMDLSDFQGRYTSQSAVAPYKTGDWVTPRKNGEMSMVGHPMVVLEAFPRERIVVDGELRSCDIRLAHWYELPTKESGVRVFYAESFNFEPWVAPEAVRQSIPSQEQPS